jgi:hypothetical protein
LPFGREVDLIAGYQTIVAFFDNQGIPVLYRQFKECDDIIVHELGGYGPANDVWELDSAACFVLKGLDWR